MPQLFRLRYFQITELVVEGNRRVPTTAIIRALGLPARVTTLEVNVRDLASRVMANPWIKTASVTRRLPSGLVIRVSERTARAVVLTDSTFLVSDDGLVLKKAEAAEEMRGLPILRLNPDAGLGPGERIDAARLDPGVRLWHLLHRDALGPGVDVLEIRVEDDGSSTVSLGHRLPYLRVREQVTRIQLDRLARVLQIRGIGLHELEYADLRFADKVIVKPMKNGEET